MSFLTRTIRKLNGSLGTADEAYKFAMKAWTALPDVNALARVLESKRFSENLAPLLMDCPAGQRVLVLAPHPDDDVFGAGGTLLRSVSKGAAVRTICITSGEADPKTELAQRREQEAGAVARAAGISVDFWRLPTRVWKAEEQAGALRRAVEEFDPDTILLPFLADDHPDHRQASSLFFHAFDNRALRCEVWAYQVYSTVLPNVIVDITDAIDRKMELVRMWRTQMEHRDWEHYLRGMHALNSRFLKTREPRYAEMFFVVPAAEYLELCRTYLSPQ